MKKQLIRIIVLILIVGAVVRFVVPDLFKPSTVRAVGDLVIDFHVPEGDPIFVVENMLPGDQEARNIDVTNGGTEAHMVKMRAVRTGGIGSDPRLETILDMVINDGAIPIYGTGSPTGSKTVENFFADFGATDGAELSVVNPGETKTYNLEVTFPSSAGNEFQNKSVIFDLIFGDGTEPTPTLTPTNTPTPSPTPTPTPPSGNLCDNITVNIFGNGVGSVNGVFIICINKKVVTQINTTIINTIINSTTNTGGNSSSGNTGTNSQTTSGSATTNSNPFFRSGTNRTR